VKLCSTAVCVHVYSREAAASLGSTVSIDGARVGPRCTPLNGVA
jgi:hypothetical protein